MLQTYSRRGHVEAVVASTDALNILQVTVAAGVPLMIRSKPFHEEKHGQFLMLRNEARHGANFSCDFRERHGEKKPPGSAGHRRCLSILADVTAHLVTIRIQGSVWHPGKHIPLFSGVKSTVKLALSFNPNVTSHIEPTCMWETSILRGA